MELPTVDAQFFFTGVPYFGDLDLDLDLDLTDRDLDLDLTERDLDLDLTDRDLDLDLDCDPNDNCRLIGVLERDRDELDDREPNNRLRVFIYICGEHFLPVSHAICEGGVVYFFHPCDNA